jgi:2Fe-2S ferredoxin
MTTLVLVSPDGEEREIAAQDGLSVMEVLRPLGLGIEGECEGSVACATCHVWLDDSQVRVASPSDDEQNMLDCVFNARENSRLSCQIIVSPALDGMRITIPD